MLTPLHCSRRSIVGSPLPFDRSGPRSLDPLEAGHALVLVGPFACHELSVPAQERGWRHDEMIAWGVISTQVSAATDQRFSAGKARVLEQS